MILLTSCDDFKYKHYKTKHIPLRQLVQKDEVEKQANASYFLISASADYSEERQTVIKVFGKVGGTYRLIEFNIEDLRIRVDDKIDKPYIYLKYSYPKPINITWLLNEPYNIDVYVLVCPNKYLPEKLLPIEI